MGARPVPGGIRMLCAVWAMSIAATAFGATPAGPESAADARSEPGLLRVGPLRELALPSEAARLAGNGDVVEIDAGTYEGDTAIWTQDRLTIRGVGGLAHMRAGSALAESKAIWVIKGANTVIEHIEFSGAAVRFRNGAGIRQEGAGLTVRYCYFHHNENGILSGPNPESDIAIEHSEFAYNGHGDGYSHNLYIGAVRSFTLRFSHVHHAVVGHNVKSRALSNHIAYNRIVDEADGRSSYAIDLPNGGISYVIGNVLQQSPATENDALVAYGAEGLRATANELYFVSNTLVNDLPAGGRFIFVKGEPAALRIVNNIFSGPGEVLSRILESGEIPGRSGNLESNVHSAKSDFVDAAAFDYRLADGAAAIGRAIDPGEANGISLRPTAEYVHRLGRKERSGRETADAGALAYERGRLSP